MQLQTQQSGNAQSLSNFSAANMNCCLICASQSRLSAPLPQNKHCVRRCTAEDLLRLSLLRSCDRGVLNNCGELYLCVGIHGQMEPPEAQLVAPDVAGDRAEDAHCQLQDDDEPNLEIEEMVVRTCRQSNLETSLVVPAKRSPSAPTWRSPKNVGWQKTGQLQLLQTRGSRQLFSSELLIEGMYSVACCSPTLLEVLAAFIWMRLSSPV